MTFTVTDKAMRPASQERRCFYCQNPIGEKHSSDCVLVGQKAKVRMIVEYEVVIPASWEKENVEFHRNEGTWCAGNALDELKKVDEEDGCLCQRTKYEFIEKIGEPFLRE